MARKRRTVALSYSSSMSADSNASSRKRARSLHGGGEDATAAASPPSSGAGATADSAEAKRPHVVSPSAAQSGASAAVASANTDPSAAASNHVPAASSTSSSSSTPATAATAPSSRSTLPRRAALLVVDVQNDFVCGSLAAPDAESIIPRINALRLAHPWPLVVFTGDAHPPAHVSFHQTHAASNPAARLFAPLTLPSGQEQVLWPVHCVRGSWGAQLHDSLLRSPDEDILVEKGRHPDQEYYSAFTSTCGNYHTDLAGLLVEHGVTDVILCGLVYEYCVGNSALDAAKAGFGTTVLTDATKGLTEEGVEGMRVRLVEAGVRLCTTNELPKELFANEPTQAPAAGVDAPPTLTRAASIPRRGFSLVQQRLHPCPPDAAVPAAAAAAAPVHSLSAPPSSALPTAPAAAGSASSELLSRSASSGPTPTLSPAASRSSSSARDHAHSNGDASATGSTSGAVTAPSPAVVRPRILLGLSGSVACIKVRDMLQALSAWAEVRIVATQRSQHFFSARDIESSMGVKVYRDEDEWGVSDPAACAYIPGDLVVDPSTYEAPLWRRGDRVLHIDLRRWADILLIAPLSAHTLAKISQGLCDNLLTTLVRAWPLQDGAKPLILAPAMNTSMWESPFTARHIAMMESLGRGVRFIQPVEKLLACGDMGQGAMAEVETIDARTKEVWEQMRRDGYVQPPPPSSLQYTGLLPVAAPSVSAPAQ